MIIIGGVIDRAGTSWAASALSPRAGAISSIGDCVAHIYDHQIEEHLLFLLPSFLSPLSHSFPLQKILIGCGVQCFCSVLMGLVLACRGHYTTDVPMELFGVNKKTVFLRSIMTW